MPSSFYIFQLVWFFVLGTAFGSFGNVMILRCPRGKSINGRSACPHCGKTLRALELIPLLSFIALRGKCSSCKKPIAWQYPLVEAASGIIFLAALHCTAVWWQGLLLAIAVWLLLIIAMFDARTQLIPDALNVPLFVIALTYSMSIDGIYLLSLGIGVGFLGLQWLISCGKWVGSGDVILIASIALLVGPWTHMALMLCMAYVMGAAVACALLVLGQKHRGDSLAFAPFLSGATLLTLVFGDWILKTLYGI